MSSSQYFRTPYCVDDARCRARIPWTDFIVETVFGLLIMSLLWLTNSWVELGFVTVVMGLLLAIALYDMKHFIIPDILLLTLTLVFLVQIIVEPFSIEKILLHLIAAAGSFLFFYLLWFMSEGKWIGFGDAKLAATLALPLTPFFAVSMIVFSFWIGTIIMLTLIFINYLQFSYTTRRIDKAYKSFTIQHKVPFAPFLVLSFVVVYVFHYNLADFLVYVW